jgi:hypothetical protein
MCSPLSNAAADERFCGDGESGNSSAAVSISVDALALIVRFLGSRFFHFNHSLISTG